MKNCVVHALVCDDDGCGYLFQEGALDEYVAVDADIVAEQAVWGDAKGGEQVGSVVGVLEEDIRGAAVVGKHASGALSENALETERDDCVVADALGWVGACYCKAWE